jgi:hypothetical protein
MRAILVIAACLFATPLSAQQQIVCVPDAAAADEASRNAGEELAWVGQSNAGTLMRFYLGRQTYSVFFQGTDNSWCTTPSMIGKIRRSDAA